MPKVVPPWPTATVTAPAQSLLPRAYAMRGGEQTPTSPITKRPTVRNVSNFASVLASFRDFLKDHIDDDPLKQHKNLFCHGVKRPRTGRVTASRSASPSNARGWQGWHVQDLQGCSPPSVVMRGSRGVVHPPTWRRTGTGSSLSKMSPCFPWRPDRFRPVCPGRDLLLSAGVAGSPTPFCSNMTGWT